MPWSTTNTECKYAQIEKEALAVTCACERSSNYVLGKSITIKTSDKPLLPLLMKPTIDKLPPRTQRYKMRLMRFCIKAVHHVEGKYYYTADTLSRILANNTTATPTKPKKKWERILIVSWQQHPPPIRSCLMIKWAKRKIRTKYAKKWRNTVQGIGQTRSTSDTS